MLARLVTIAVTIAITMMFGRSMSSERARFSNVLSESCIVIRQLRLVKGISLTQRIVVLERTFGRGDRSYPAHRCLGKAWQACLESVCRAPRGPTGAPRGLVWGVAIVRSAKTAVWLPLPGPPGGLSGAPGGLSGSPGGLPGAPGRLVWPAWSTPGCAAGCLERLERREDCLERLEVRKRRQERRFGISAPRGSKSSKSPKRTRTLRSPVPKFKY